MSTAAPPSRCEASANPPAPRTSSARAARCLAGLVALAALATLGACGAGGDTDAAPVTTPDPEHGGTLVYGLESNPIGLDPTKGAWDASGLMVANAVFDPLMALDKDLRPQPYLAESLTPNSDYTEWTMTLRPDVTFHNGDPFTADAVVALLDAHLGSLLTGPATWPIVRAEALDELTVRAYMEQPWSSFPMILTTQGGYVPHPDTYASEDGARHPIGTGPFAIEEWALGERISLIRNDDYWRDGLPYLDEVEFVISGPESPDLFEIADLDAFHTGNQSLALSLEQRHVEFEAILDEGESEENFVMLNTAKPALADVRVRRAVALATDVDAWQAEQGRADTPPIDGPLSISSPFYRDSDYPTYDLDAARALVEEIEADSGPISFVLTTVPAISSVSSAYVLADQWAEAGMDVTVETVSQSDLIILAAIGEYDAVIFRLFWNPDPDSDFYWWHSRNAQPIGEIALNFARLDDAQIDDALIDGRTTEDQVARIEAYGRLQDRLSELVPYVWLDRAQWSVIAWPGIHDLANGELPDGQPALPMSAGVHRLTQTWVDTSA